MATMDDLTRDEAQNEQTPSPIRRLTGLAQASASTAPSLALQSQGAARQSPAQRLTGGPLTRAASMTPAVTNPMDDGSFPSSIQAVAQQASTPSTPRIAQMAAGDSAAGAGRGFVNPDGNQPSPIAALTVRSASGPTSVPVAPDSAERRSTMASLQQQAATPRIAQLASASVQQPGALSASRIIGGGDTTYSPGMAPRTEAFQTADGRRIDPSDANLSAADSGLISQYKAQNAQALADIERQQRTNPLAGAVQIIRPGNDVSYAVQGADRMIEIGGDDFDAYQSALTRNPQMGSQMQMTEGGMRIGGLLAPPELADAGPEALQKFAQAQQQNTLDAANPLEARTAAEIRIAAAKEAAQAANNMAVAQLQADTTRRGQDLTDGRQRDLNVITKTNQQNETLDKKVTNFSKELDKTNAPQFDSLLTDIEADISKYKDGDIPGFGRSGSLPQFMLSKEGQGLRQKIATLQNLTLKDRSGAAVTNQELQRLLNELGTGVLSTDDQLRGGLTNVRKNFNAVKQNVVAGVDDTTLAEYMARGGMRLERGPGAANRAPAGTANPRNIDLTKVRPGDGNFEAVMADAERIGALRNQPRTATASSKPSLDDIFGNK